MCQYAQKRLESRELVAFQHFGGSEVPFDCSFSRECPELTGWENVHGKLSGILQLRQNVDRTLRNSKRVEDGGQCR